MENHPSEQTSVTICQVPPIISTLNFTFTKSFTPSSTVSSMIRVLATSRGVVLPALQNRVTTVVTSHQSANNRPTDLQQCHQQWIRTQRLKSRPEVRPLFLSRAKSPLSFQSLSKIKVESFNFPTSSPTQSPCSAVVSLPCFSATNFLNLTNTCGQKPCFRATSLQPSPTNTRSRGTPHRVGIGWRRREFLASPQKRDLLPNIFQQREIAF